METQTRIAADAGGKILVAATRMHLGKASKPPAQRDLDEKVAAFLSFCRDSCRTAAALIAVDATPKIEGYDYVDAVRTACRRADGGIGGGAPGPSSASDFLQVLPVTPWGRFAPALNALVSFAAEQVAPRQPDLMLFVSAETSASAASMRQLLGHMCGEDSDDVLVAGALLPGHDYRFDQQEEDEEERPASDSVSEGCALGSSHDNQPTAVEVELDGRTTPWNTLAVWNWKKLALTGFPLVAEGLLTDSESDPSFGVEEAVTIALLQKMLGGPASARAKLVHLSNDGVAWQRDFDDPERAQWHEEKMQSKLSRAARQLQLTGLRGRVWHC